MTFRSRIVYPLERWLWLRRGPSVWQSIRQTLGRALRESGHALDRSGLRLESFTWLPDKYVGGDPVTVWQDFLSRHRQQLPLLSAGRPVVSPDAAFVAPCATLVGAVRIQPGASVWYGAVLRADSCLNASSYAMTDEEILQHALEGTEPLLLAHASPEEEEEEEAYPDEKNAFAADEQDKEKDDAIAERHDDDDDNKPPQHYRPPEKRRNLQDEPHLDGGGIYIGADTNVQDGVLITAKRGSTVIGQGVTIGHLAQLHSVRVDDYALIGMGSYLGPGVHVESEALVAAGAVVPPNTRIAAGELWIGHPARKMRNLTPEERQKLHYQSSEYVQVALSHRGVEQLGGNLPPELDLLECVRYNVENEPETVHDQIMRRNKWTQTVYREYLPPPPPHPALIRARRGRQALLEDDADENAADKKKDVEALGEEAPRPQIDKSGTEGDDDSATTETAAPDKAPPTEDAAAATGVKVADAQPSR